MNTVDVLILKYTPMIYFHKDENSFPISIEKYLSVSTLNRGSEVLDAKPTPASIYKRKVDGEDGLNLSFFNPNWEETLKGSPTEAVGYVKVIETADVITLIYFFLFSHTEPYKCCLFGFPMTQYAHKADLKFMCVEIGKTPQSGVWTPKRVFYGAHGTQSGVWKAYSDVEKVDTHPVAYSAKEDHSFYFDSGAHPRIYFVAWDMCGKDKVCLPIVSRVYREDEKEFSPETHGWTYLPGTMNVDGIAAPFRQNFWEANIPSESNSAFKRLFCPNFF